MFYEVRIFNAMGKLKEKYSDQELSRRYWKEFEEKEAGRCLVRPRVQKLSVKMKKELDAKIASVLHS